LFLRARHLHLLCLDCSLLIRMVHLRGGLSLLLGGSSSLLVPNQLLLLVVQLLCLHALHLRMVRVHLHSRVHAHVHGLHLRHLLGIVMRILHGHRHLPLLLHLRHHSSLRNYLLLLWCHALGEVHLRMLLLEHGLLRTHMCHSHAIMHWTKRRCAGVRRHACDHRALSDLRSGDTRMHALHHSWSGLATHMRCARVLHSHRMASRYSRMARRKAGVGELLGHHLEC
jgi:hypothetical protein